MRYAVLRSVGDGSAFPRGNVRRRLRRAAHLSLVGATLLLGGAAAPAQPSQAR
ncbi:transglutaminase family protein cysteine peptidase BTLCP, partial [Methylorubrum extorquens DSM 13060]